MSEQKTEIITYPRSLAGGRKRKTYGLSYKRRTKARVYGPVNRPSARVPYNFNLAGQSFRKFAKLNYTESIIIGALAAATPKYYSFNANGLYDPRVALNGHQPYGFDQLMAEYQHYTVLKCYASCEVSLANAQLNCYYMLCVHTHANDLTVVHTAALANGAYGGDGFFEMPYHTSALMPNRISQATKSARIVADIPKLTGKSVWNLIGSAAHQGEAGSNPTEDLFVTLIVFSPVDAIVADCGTATIHLTYYTCFTEPKFMVTS